MWLPSKGYSDVTSLSVVVGCVVVDGAGVVIGLSVETTQQNYSIGRHGLRTRLNISETNLNKIIKGTCKDQEECSLCSLPVANNDRTRSVKQPPNQHKL